MIVTLSFVGFHYQLFSPTLEIRVPNGYVGEIDLVLSVVDENMLTVDSNGIGYLNSWTFFKTSHLVYEILQIVQGYRTYSNTIKIKSKIGKMFPVCASMRLYP